MDDEQAKVVLIGLIQHMQDMNLALTTLLKSSIESKKNTSTPLVPGYTDEAYIMSVIAKYNSERT